MNAEFAPLLPLWAIIALGLLLVAASLVRLSMAPLGAILRVLAAAAGLLFLLGPERVFQTTEGLPDQALILVDESASMALGERPEIREQVLQSLQADLEELGLDTQTARFGDASSSEFASGLGEALSTVQRQQLGAVFVLTDGQVSQAEEALALDVPAPVHSLLIPAAREETDRRISWVQTPRFGLIGEPLTLSFRIDDSQGVPTMPVRVRIDGEDVLSRAFPVGQDVTLEITIDRPGERVVELGIPSVEGEMTVRNNAISGRVNIIRDRLRVLLISGEPHAGERVWRNVLKSDPAVDLVHFTILKPGDKIAPAAPEELNLIPFPSRELFLDKLEHFNVVIFDRYTYRGVISSFELAEVARFVEEGGAVLVAAGPELTLGGSLARQPNLSYILPATPSAQAQEYDFVPSRTDLGSRHPITNDLADADDWGRWLRVIPSDVRRGNVLMEAEDQMPLLVTDRVGEGRVAMMLSDHLWLWARGFDGGGPHREFLRRLVHWLMAEPELEEESLTAHLSEDGELTVERRSLSDSVAPVRLSEDDVPRDPITLDEREPGAFSSVREGLAADRVRLETTTEDGRTLTAAAVRERGSSSELEAVTLEASHLTPLSRSTGGQIIATRGENLDLRRVAASRERAFGRDWLGVARRNAQEVLAEERSALLPRWAYFLLSLGLLLGAWVLESGYLKSRRSAA